MILDSQGECGFVISRIYYLSNTSALSDHVYSVRICKNNCESCKRCPTDFQILAHCSCDEVDESNVRH